MNCPTNDELLAYTTGRLDEQTTEAITEHIRDCETCLTRLDTIDDSQDTLLARLRGAPEVDQYEQEPQCEEAVERVAAVMAAAAGQARSKAGFAAQAVAEPECPPTFAADEPRGGPAATADATTALVRELGEYELLEKLGEGGMGAVYKARHRRLDKIVAVKVLPPDRMSDPLALARFDREMRAVGRVTHPNIVQAFDAREIDGTHFLAMEYVAGMDLGEVVLNGGAMRIADACEVVRQMASGLQCAHENGLVHRDIKPSNAILTPGGQVKILDLGLARLSGGAANVEASRGEMTSSGTAMGTADYMAPEQASDSHTADIRADIYSLGCTLYKLLSGKPPFSGPKYKNAMEKIMGHMRDTPPPIGLLRTDVSADLAAVIGRMMAKDRDARFATPQEVLDALLPFAAGANLVRLYREADAMRRGEPLAEQSVLGTEPGVPSAVSDTTRLGQLAQRGDLSSRLAHPASAPVASSVSLAGARNLVRSWPRILIALGLVGLVVLAGVIVITVRDRYGKIISQTTVPDDSKVEVTHQAEKPTAAASVLPTGQWIMLLKSEEDLKAWEKTGAGTVTFDNGALRVQNAAVTYPTLAIDLVIRVQIQVEVSVKPTAKLLLRQTPTGSYAAVLEDGTKLVLGVTEGDKWRELKTAPVTVPTDQPVALEFSAIGNVLTISLNGKPAIEVQDGTHSYGSPGLAATDGTTVFKDVDVKVTRGTRGKEVEIAKSTERVPPIQPAAPARPSFAKSGDKAPHSQMPLPIGRWISVLESEDDLSKWKVNPRVQVTFTAEGVELDSAASRGIVVYPASRVDVAIRARVKKVSGQNLGLFVRSSDEGYCSTWFNGDNAFGVGFVAYKSGQPYRTLARAPTAESFNDFFDFEFAAVGNQLRVFVNGLLIIRAEESTVAHGTTGIGVVTGKSIFRDVEIKVLTSRDGKAGELSQAEQERLIAELEAEHRPTWNLPDDSPPPAIAPFDAKKAEEHQKAWAKYLGVEVESENSIGIRFVLIPPGEFDMGSTEAEVAKLLEEAKATNQPSWYIERLPAEAPKHRVRITKPFWLGRHEITRSQFRRFVDDRGYQTEAERNGKGGYGLVNGQMKQDPRFVWNADLGFEQADDHPVVNVSWNDVTAFCQWLSQKEGEASHLPTEAQWEYACRAGTTTTWYLGDDEAGLKDNAWFNANAGGKAHPVGEKSPNAWGLYDMHGNVWEWCQDWWGDRYYETSRPDESGGSDRVDRGGSWFGCASGCRASYRGRRDLRACECNLGFRLAMAIPFAEGGAASARKIGTDSPPPKPAEPAITPPDAARKEGGMSMSDILKNLAVYRADPATRNISKLSDVFLGYNTRTVSDDQGHPFTYLTRPAGPPRLPSDTGPRPELPSNYLVIDNKIGVDRNTHLELAADVFHTKSITGVAGTISTVPGSAIIGLFNVSDSKLYVLDVDAYTKLKKAQSGVALALGFPFTLDGGNKSVNVAAESAAFAALSKNPYVKQEDIPMDRRIPVKLAIYAAGERLPNGKISEGLAGVAEYQEYVLEYFIVEPGIYQPFFYTSGETDASGVGNIKLIWKQADGQDVADVQKAK